MHKSEKRKWSHSVMSDSSRPHGLQPTRLLRPWDFPGKSTGVGCRCLLCGCLHIVAIFIVAKIWKPPRLFFSWLKKSIHFFLIEIWKISHWNVKDFYCFTSWSSWFTIPNSHHFVRKEHYIPDKVIQKLQQPSSFPLTFSPPPGEKTILGQPCSRRRDTQNRPNLNLRPGHNSSPMFPWTLAVWHRSKHYTHISIWYMVYIPFLLLEPTFRQRLVYFIHDHRT